jgi:RecB family endonuclease NucS
VYIINKETKIATAIEKKSFSELGFTERYDLQEWIANQPSILGEDLLIIQKEFDGFSDTKERLDLLALD